MSNYARLSRKQKYFHALTGYTHEEFHALLPAFRTSFLKHVEIYTLEGKKRRAAMLLIATVLCRRPKIILCFS